VADALPVELSRLFAPAPADAAARDTAWDGFTAAYSRLLLHTARSITSDHDSAMDAYAYLLEQLRADDFKRLRAYTPVGRGKFTTWLVVVVRRLCLDFRRQRYGRPRTDTTDDAAARATRRRLIDLIAAPQDPDEIPASGKDPATAALSSDLGRILESALAGLMPEDRLLLKLRYEDDLPAREIAALLRMASPFHVYRRINALLTQLRGSLRARGVDDSAP
jgi:RNA polymerase sigma factor (sigma-70 family)